MALLCFSSFSCVIGNKDLVWALFLDRGFDGVSDMIPNGLMLLFLVKGVQGLGQGEDLILCMPFLQVFEG